MRRHHADGGVAHRGGEHRGRPRRRPGAVADRKQRPDQRTHHVVAERVGDDARNRDALGVALPVKAAQRAHRGRALPAPAEGGEVVLPDQRRGSGVHGGQVEPARVPEGVTPAQRVRRGEVVADPVGVPAPERGKPGVEALRRRRYPPHPDVRRQRPGEAPRHGAGPGRPRVLGQIRVRDLPPRVHPGVGPPGHGQPRRLAEPEHPPQRLREHALYRPAFRLRRPARELRPVIGKIKSYPNDRG